MATRRQAARPQDFTGREAARLAKERDDDQARRSAELAMATAAEAEAKEELVDLTEAAPPPAENPEPSGEVEVRRPHRVIRVNSTIEQMTFGHGNTYDFEAGRQYKVPADLADHLEAKGFVWH